jgi:hypothetical protein
MSLRPLYVASTSFWAPGFATFADYRAGKKDPSLVEPAADVLGSRIRRGTSLCTLMTVDAIARASRDAGFDLASTPSVFASCYGEIQIALLQLDMMREGDGLVSPARFKNSVHNTGSGVYSIAAQNRGFTTALAGGLETVAIALLEAFLLTEREHSTVLVTMGDEALPRPLYDELPYEGFAAAFALTTEKPAGVAARLQSLRMTPREGDAPTSGSDPFLLNPCRPAIDLLTAIDERAAGPLSLTRRGEVGWTVDLAFES